MLFQPAIIALLLASGISVVVLVVASPWALSLVRHWDLASGSERQVVLERRTYLLSTLLALVFATQLVALLLFVFNADRMAAMFVGAMCAVGTLNVNPYGFPALLAQVLAFFLAASWLVINHVDTRAPDYPLVRIKYLLLIAIAPFVATAFALQLAYFLGLEADVITSCCGSLFSAGSKTLSSEVSALPPGAAIAGFFAALAGAIGANAAFARRPARWLGYLAAGASILAFAAALIGIVSFLSLYIYEHPHHHCPFCILKAEYDHQGYALYLPLFAATAAGLGVGAVQPFARVASLAAVVPATAQRLAGFAALAFAAFTALAAGMLLASNLALLES